MLLSVQDWNLSMKISRRSRKGDPVTRSLLVHRLRTGAKAVLRLRLSANIETATSYGMHCEPCGRWLTCEAGGEEFVCPVCGGMYVLEFAVFARVN